MEWGGDLKESSVIRRQRVIHSFRGVNHHLMICCRRSGFIHFISFTQSELRSYLRSLVAYCLVLGHSNTAYTPHHNPYK